MRDSADLTIIGGGAAGLATAIFAAQAAHPRTRIVVLDGAQSLGAKILVAGGGRCNVTHDLVSPDDYNGPRTLIRNILSAFDAAATVRWFASLGVELKREETGKLFPVSNSARTVLQALLGRCQALNVSLRTGMKVRSIAWNGAVEASAEQDPSAKFERRAAHEGGGEAAPFAIQSDAGELHSSRVVLATGGRSLPRSGSDGSGWDIASRLGHTVTPTFAALAPLVLAPSMFHASLAGISQMVELTVFLGGKRIDRRVGSLLWTHFGVSGPVVMDASRHWVIARESGGDPQMKCNLLPPDDFETAERWLIEQASARAKSSIVTVLSQRLSERTAAAVLAFCKIDPALPIAHLSRELRRTLVHALTALPLPVQQHRGWNYAEVTAGGVPLAEIDYRTMESRKVPGLYLAGEILDCDGRIGGFNFQWAWATGYIAGAAAAKSIS